MDMEETNTIQRTADPRKSKKSKKNLPTFKLDQDGEVIQDMNQ